MYNKPINAGIEVSVILQKKSAFTVCALIGMSFLMTGSTYITWWLYKLPLVFNSTAVDVLSEGVGYLFQVLGMLAFSLFIKKNEKRALSAPFFIGIVIADGLATVLAFISSTVYGILVFGYLMNLLHGAVFAYYLTRLTQLVPQQKRGIVFGAAYAFGSVGSWVLSLPLDGGFLGSPYVLIVYAAIYAAILWIDRKCRMCTSDGCDTAAPLYFKKSILPLAAVVVVLLSVVKGLGFYFPSVDHFGGAVNAVFMRAFYAIGLIAAGLVNDKNRKLGAICCVAALIFPFITFGLGGKPAVGAILWIAGYIFFGFFSVYRVVTFADLAGKRNNLLPLAGFGLLLGRVGDAASAFLGVALHMHFPILLAISSVLFVVTILVFFQYYNEVYASALPQEDNAEARLRGFEKEYALSAREAGVFMLIVNGRSNSEIAADLYIAESTVKFHVKNILRKTACANRTQLVSKFKRNG
ncbi:MAG: helix-turn-helix transcriptional regulator [Eubacteriales bacterium]|nr:helix-turn-helix transcriptional regulator [Eubacteriales bacterium]